MLIKQPNGKYCYFGYSFENKMAINLTKEEYTQIRMNELLEDIEREMKDENLMPISSLIKEIKVSDEDLRSMGYEKTYEEMLKYIPKYVSEKSYCDRDCTTYGKCPTCGEPVQNGMGGTDKECRKCGQVLKWY